MNGRGLDDRDMSDMVATCDLALAKRVLASLQHPDCPTHMFEFEASKLARHIAIRLNRSRASIRPTQGEHKLDGATK